MKLPSLSLLYKQAKNSAIRFPLTILSALFGVTIAITLIELEKSIENLFPYINLMLCFALAIPLFYSVTVYAQKANKLVWLYRSAAIILLILMYFSLPNTDETFNTSVPYIRYAIMNIAAHLLVSFIPYFNQKEENGFWQYNKTLFIRFLASLLYSGVLYLGIVLALVSLNLLFDIDIDDKLYFELFVVLAGLFNTWFFVAGTPQNFDELEQNRLYPKGLKIFTQFILLPLLCLYLLILYGYGAKIVLLWDWPKGLVSYLIVCVAVLGIFTLLLLHPFRKLSENTWIARFSRVYYFILVPLVVLLFIAITMRIGDYGITVNRYIILLLGVWLTIVCFYFISGKTNIKLIPISLFVLIILMSFGPWGMFSVSEKSQVKRLNRILTAHNLLIDGKIAHENKLDSNDVYNYNNLDESDNNLTLQVPDSVHNEIKSILDYMDDFHGFNAVKPWYVQDIDSLIHLASKQKYRYVNEAQLYMNALGLEYRHIYTYPENDYFNYSIKYQPTDIVDIKGYSYLANLNIYDYTSNGNYSYTNEFEADSVKYHLFCYKKTASVIRFTQNKQLLFKVDVMDIAKQLKEKYGSSKTYDIPIEDCSVITNQYKLIVEHISFTNKNNQLKLNQATCKLYIK